MKNKIVVGCKNLRREVSTSMAIVYYGDHSISSSNTMEPKFANYCSKERKKKEKKRKKTIILCYKV